MTVTHDIDTAMPRKRAAADPVRRCIVSGENAARGRMLRFVVTPDGGVVPDLAGRLPGRGLWLSPRRDLVIRACEKRAFGRAARRAVANPEAPALLSLLERELVRRLVDGLGLARRAGMAVAGNEKLRGWLRGGMPRPERSGPQALATLLFVASDAAAGSRDKVLGQVRAAGLDVRLARCLDSAELGRAFGRERTMFAAVAPCRLGARLWDDVNRLSGFRNGPALACGDA